MAQAGTRSTTRPGRYAVGMFGTSIPIGMFLAYMAFFYIDGLGLDARVFAAVMIGYAVVDAIDNPLYGYLSDRTRGRFGRRRPWLIAGAPLLALSLVLFFSPPQGAEGLRLVVWFAVFAILTETLDSLVNANYGALLPELFPDHRRRATANSLRQGAQLVALVISVALTPLVTSLIGYRTTAIIYGALAATAILYTALGAHEDPRAQTSPEPGIVESVRAIFGTATFWRIAVANGAYASAMTLVVAGAPFFVKYALELPDANATYLLASVILISMGTLALWTRAVHRVGPLPVWRASLAVLAAALVPMYLATSLVGAVVAGALVGLGYSGVIATADLVMARLLDLDAARTGLRREGMFIAAFGFFNRLSAVVKSVAFLTIATVFGFVSGDDPGTRPGDAARFLMTVFPFALVVVAAITARTVRLPGPEPEQHADRPAPGETRDLP